MKRLSFIFLFVSVIFPFNVIYGQSSVFEKYNFSSNDYTVYFSYWENNTNDKTQRIFYIDNPDELKEIQNKVMTKSVSNDYLGLCGNDYTIYIAKKDSLVDVAYLNKDCKTFELRDKTYNLNAFHIFTLLRYGKELVYHYQPLNNIQEARLYVKSKTNKCYFFPYGYSQKKILPCEGKTIYEKRFIVNNFNKKDPKTQ